MLTWSVCALAHRRLALVLIGVCAAMIPAVAGAQTSFLVVPSIKVVQLYDSNLFSDSPSNRQGDLISRVSPAIESDLRARRFTLSSRYTADTERYADHPRLTTLQARQHADVNLGFHATPRLALEADTAFTKTQVPGELNAEIGATVLRATAQRVAAHASATYQLDPSTNGTLEYGFTDDLLAGGVRLAAHSATLAAERQLSPRDAATVGYVFDEFLFGSTEAVRSHTFSVGWIRGITRAVSISLRGGPRISDRTAAPELSASASYRFRPGELSVTYARAQTTLIGLAGTVDTNGLSTTVTCGAPASLQMRIASGVVRISRAGLESRVYRASAGASHLIARGLSLEAGYDVTFQRGDLYALRARDTMSRRVLLISVAVLPPSRMH
jgi:hypothetical protein